MQRNRKNLVAAMLLGLALAIGGVSVGQIAQPTPAVACSPGNCTGSGGGG
ncbi:MAG: hypothetical protein HC822_03885 [Oscillochloris sp.]|nr:hypothetical protein [Oscillochloris sp.]